MPFTRNNTASSTAAAFHNEPRCDLPHCPCPYATAARAREQMMQVTSDANSRTEVYVNGTRANTGAIGSGGSAGNMPSTPGNSLSRSHRENNEADRYFNGFDAGVALRNFQEEYPLASESLGAVQFDHPLQISEGDEVRAEYTLRVDGEIRAHGSNSVIGVGSTTLTHAGSSLSTGLSPSYGASKKRARVEEPVVQLVDDPAVGSMWGNT